MGFYLNFLFCFLLFSQLYSQECISQKNLIERVYSHLLINNPQNALEDARWGMHYYGTEKSMWRCYLNALSKNENEQESRTAWNRFFMLFPEEYDNHQLIENRAWGTLNKGYESTSPIIRNLALVGAYFSQDARGVKLIERALSDPNQVLRSIAIELASQLRDDQLQKKILFLLGKELNWQIRIRLILAAGRMHIIEAKPILTTLIESSHSSDEERSAAIQALVEMTDSIQREELAKLVKSERAGMRQLACQIISHCELGEYSDLIIPLLQDHHAQVRTVALYALGIVEEKSDPALLSTIISQSILLLNDPDPHVSITAAWLLAIKNTNIGLVTLKRWIEDDNPETRVIAASALVASGKYGINLLMKEFYLTTDPYVCMNLAFGLIYHRVDVEKACQVLLEGLLKENQRLMWKEQELFRVLAPSTLKYNDAIPQYPEVVNQLTRLEIINILAMMKSPFAQQALLAFLEKKTWGITGVASALLLTEGDESAVELIQPLLCHPNFKVRIQSALILALWGRDEASIAVLQQSYLDADRELKEKILEGLGRLGAPSSIPFLINQLNNPSQSLRILAASALLQCLYH